MTKVGIIRHAVTAVNKQTGGEIRSHGHAGAPLDEEGLQQAEKVAARVSGETWDVLYCSDVMRAMQTAAIIAGELGDIEIRVSRSLRERSVVPFFDTILAEYQGRNILLVSHAGKIRLLLKQILPQGNFDVGIRNASLTIIEQTEDGWRCPLFNCIRHLEEQAGRSPAPA